MEAFREGQSSNVKNVETSKNKKNECKYFEIVSQQM
jgi:hypothetical protein